MKKILMVTAVLAMVAGAAQAGVVGYWRFEGDGTDETGNRDLAAWNDAGGAATTVAYSGFDNPIPQTGAANASAATFSPSGMYYNNQGYEVRTAVEGGAFTIEAYLREESRGNNTAAIFSLWGNAGSYSLHYGVNSTSGNLVCYFSGDGSNVDAVDSGISLDLGVNYFVALSYGAGDVTFHVKNVDTDTWLSAVTDTTFASLNGWPYIRIGNDQTAVSDFDGEIDEVRVSDTVLGQGELLASIPEPATLSLFGLIGGGLLWIRKKFTS